MGRSDEMMMGKTITTRTVVTKQQLASLFLRIMRKLTKLSIFLDLSDRRRMARGQGVDNRDA